MKTGILEMCIYAKLLQIWGTLIKCKGIPLSVKQLEKFSPPPSPAFKFLWYKVAQSQERT